MACEGMYSQAIPLPLTVKTSVASGAAHGAHSSEVPFTPGQPISTPIRPVPWGGCGGAPPGRGGMLGSAACMQAGGACPPSFFPQQYGMRSSGHGAPPPAHNPAAAGHPGFDPLFGFNGFNDDFSQMSSSSMGTHGPDRGPLHADLPGPLVHVQPKGLVNQCKASSFYDPSGSVSGSCGGSACGVPGTLSSSSSTPLPQAPWLHGPQPPSQQQLAMVQGMAHNGVSMPMQGMDSSMSMPLPNQQQPGHSLPRHLQGQRSRNQSSNGSYHSRNNNGGLNSNSGSNNNNGSSTQMPLSDVMLYYAQLQETAATIEAQAQAQMTNGFSPLQSLASSLGLGSSQLRQSSSSATLAQLMPHAQDVALQQLASSLVASASANARMAQQAPGNSIAASLAQLMQANGSGARYGGGNGMGVSSMGMGPGGNAASSGLDMLSVSELAHMRQYLSQQLQLTQHNQTNADASALQAALAAMALNSLPQMSPPMSSITIPLSISHPHNIHAHARMLAKQRKAAAAAASGEVRTEPSQSAAQAAGSARLNARQRRTLRRAKERAIKGLLEAGSTMVAASEAGDELDGDDSDSHVMEGEHTEVTEDCLDDLLEATSDCDSLIDHDHALHSPVAMMPTANPMPLYSRLSCGRTTPTGADGADATGSGSGCGSGSGSSCSACTSQGGSPGPEDAMMTIAASHAVKPWGVPGVSAFSGSVSPPSETSYLASGMAADGAAAAAIAAAALAQGSIAAAAGGVSEGAPVLADDADIADLIAKLTLKKEEGVVNEKLIRDLQIIQNLLSVLKPSAPGAQAPPPPPANGPKITPSRMQTPPHAHQMTMMHSQMYGVHGAMYGQQDARMGSSKMMGGSMRSSYMGSH